MTGKEKMTPDTAVFFMRKIKEAFEEGHLNTEAEALQMGIDALRRPEPQWNRMMMYLADLQLTYSPNWGANGQGDKKLYDFVTGLIEELEGWTEPWRGEET